MTLVAAAVVPGAPLVVPSLASGAAPELDVVRDECARAVDAVFATSPDVVYVVGADSSPHATSMQPWGAHVAVDVPEPLPLACLVGGWLTRGRSRSFVVVDPSLDRDECAELGRELADSAGRVGLVVVGDGSSRHTEKAPGYIHPQASSYDDRLSLVFRDADIGTLLGLDRGEAAELWVAGVPTWQVLAGAASGRDWQATASLSVPYGVGYHVASWT